MAGPTILSLSLHPAARRVEMALSLQSTPTEKKTKPAAVGILFRAWSISICINGLEAAGSVGCILLRFNCFIIRALKDQLPSKAIPMSISCNRVSFTIV